MRPDRLGRRLRRQCGDGSEQHAPVAYGRNPDLFQILDCQVRENRLPDPVVEKRSLILAKAETAKPLADIHGPTPMHIEGIRLAERCPATTALFQGKLNARHAIWERPLLPRLKRSA